MTKLLSFHGDKKIKARYLKRLKEHQDLDEIVQGTGFESNGKTRGCAVGCTLDKYDHGAYETELGIPEWLARLEDFLFEHLPVEDAPKFAVDFLESIPVGVDLKTVEWKFCAYILKENIGRVLSLKIKEKLKLQVIEAIQSVLRVHENAIRTGNWDLSAAESAALSAESAADSALRAALSSAQSAAWSAESSSLSAESAARSSAQSAAWSSAQSAAWSSAQSAAWSAAQSAAWSAEYRLYADELLRLLRTAK